jgi:hypothetical protein
MTPGYMNVTCTGCGPPPVCKSGTYPDWDSCDNNCYQGACEETAGEPGVVCKCSGD